MAAPQADAPAARSPRAGVLEGPAAGFLAFRRDHRDLSMPMKPSAVRNQGSAVHHWFSPPG